MWAKVKTGGKLGFDKVYGVVDKLGAPVNKLSNKLGAEAFWPTSIDKESDKAARILRSFCSMCITSMIVLLLLKPEQKMVSMKRSLQTRLVVSKRNRKC
jgi:hypothetical protein